MVYFLCGGALAISYYGYHKGDVFATGAGLALLLGTFLVWQMLLPAAIGVGG